MSPASPSSPVDRAAVRQQSAAAGRPARLPGRPVARPVTRAPPYRGATPSGQQGAAGAPPASCAAGMPCMGARRDSACRMRSLTADATCWAPHCAGQCVQRHACLWGDGARSGGGGAMAVASLGGGPRAEFAVVAELLGPHRRMHICPCRTRRARVDRLCNAWCAGAVCRSAASDSRVCSERARATARSVVPPQAGWAAGDSATRAHGPPLCPPSVGFCAPMGEVRVLLEGQCCSAATEGTASDAPGSGRRRLARGAMRTRANALPASGGAWCRRSVQG